MEKKKLKLKSPKKIKETIKNDLKMDKKKKDNVIDEVMDDTNNTENLNLDEINELNKDGKEKKPKRKKKSKKKGKATHTFLIILMSIGIAIVTTILAFGLYIVFTAPEFTVERLYNKESSVIYDVNGTLITRLGTENRVLKNYEDFPQVLVDALVATEDSRFFQHNGFDAGRFLKASLGQAAGNSDAGGASTITMQLVKQNFTSSTATGIEGIIRKFTDIYMSIFKIEKTYTKQQIIEFYFNSMWLASGGINYESINGVEQACQYYFGKSVSDISLGEAAIIVGMYNNPTLFNPYIYPENATERRSTVLSLMVRHGYITEQEKEDAESIPVESLLRSDIDKQNAKSPYQNLIDFVINDIKEKLNINIDEGGYSVKTTFDLKKQDIVNNLQNGAAWQFKDDKVQVGVAITSTKDGSITALGPGRNYVAKGTDRSTTPRQPGSTAKPIFDYGPLIEYNNVSPQQLMLDYPYTYNNGTTMNNWDFGYTGATTVKQALAASRNIPALEAFHMVEPEKIAEFVHNLGIDYGDSLNEAFSVGGLPYGWSPLQASAAYASFGRGGYYIEPYSFTEVKNLQTEEVINWKYEKKRVMSEETAYLINDILVYATATGVGGNINYNLRNRIGSKTGTSNISEEDAARKGIPSDATPDQWINSYNPDYSISTWLGYDQVDMDSSHYFTMGMSSIPRNQLGAYLSNNIFTTGDGFPKPSGLTTVTIESQTLPPKLASKNTPANMKISATFKSGTEPSEVSTRYNTLQDPSNVRTSVHGEEITVSWNGITAPADNNTKDFNDYFKSFARNYPNSFKNFYNRYMSLYNNSNLGSLGYEVFVKEDGGSLKDLGWTDKTSYTYKPTKSGNYELVVRSSYSNYKGNQSNGVSSKASVTVEGSQEETPSNSDGLVATAKTICVTKGSVINAKEAVTVTYNGKNVTRDATIVYSNVDTSREQSVAVTYSITYNGEQTTAKGTVNIRTSCGDSSSLD